MDRPRHPLRNLLASVLAAIGVASPAVATPTEEEFASLRRALVAELALARPGLPSRLDPRVLDAMGRVKRHLFVPEPLRARAYDNRPLPIGHGQTISQPYIVALMTDLLKLGRQDKVLEVGTGSGYQAAVLAELAQSVYTIEIVEPLALQARERLEQLGYRNVQVRAGDGYKGWEEAAPFDAIIVTAGATHVPDPLVRQLKPGGRMVIPVGDSSFSQDLLLIEKQPDGTVRSRKMAPVLFVPLTGGH